MKTIYQTVAYLWEKKNEACLKIEEIQAEKCKIDGKCSKDRWDYLNDQITLLEREIIVFENALIYIEGGK